MPRHPDPPLSLISERDSFENNVSKLSSVTISLKDVNIPEGNDLAFDHANDRFYLKYTFPCFTSVSDRLCREQECQSKAVSSRQIDFGHQLVVNINCNVRENIAELWRSSVLKMHLVAGRKQIGTAKIPLKSLLSFPFSLRERVYFKSEKTRLYPSAEVRIELNSNSQVFQDQLLAVRRQILEKESSRLPTRGRSRSASAHISSAPGRGSASVMSPISEVSSISDDVFHPPSRMRERATSAIRGPGVKKRPHDAFIPTPREPGPATPVVKRDARDAIPVYVSPMSMDVVVPKIPLRPKQPSQPQHRAIRVQIYSARRLPLICHGRQEELPSTFVCVSTEGGTLCTPIAWCTTEPVWNWSKITYVSRACNSFVVRLKHVRTDKSEQVLGIAVIDWRKSGVQEVIMKSDLILNNRTGTRGDAFPILKIKVCEEGSQPDSDSSSVPSETASVLGERLARASDKVNRGLRC